MAKEGRPKFNPRPGRGLNSGPSGWQSEILPTVPTSLSFRGLWPNFPVTPLTYSIRFQELRSTLKVGGGGGGGGGEEGWWGQERASAKVVQMLVCFRDLGRFLCSKIFQFPTLGMERIFPAGGRAAV